MLCGAKARAVCRKRHEEGAMSNLQMIEMLCGLVERQAGIIHRLAMELEQLRSLSEMERDMVENSQREYAGILGADEFPDNL